MKSYKEELKESIRNEALFILGVNSADVESTEQRRKNALDLAIKFLNEFESVVDLNQFVREATERIVSNILDEMEAPDLS